jgi:O-Antigen ligase
VVAWGLLMMWSKWRREAAQSDGEPTTPSAQTRRGRRVSIRVKLMAVAARVAVVATCMLVSNFSARLAPDYTLSDRSALNRIDLWKGGLELVAASPLRGWGWGESGAAYMQWTQPLDRTEGYKSMVNSYLTVAVEAGLPVFAVLLAGLLAPLALGTKLARNASGARWAFAPGLSACWATWLGCLFFSNLWIIPKLWIVPGVAAVVLGGWSALSLTRWFWRLDPPTVGRLLAGAPVNEREQARSLPNYSKSPSASLHEPARAAVTPYLATAFAAALVMGLALWLAGSYFARATSLLLTRESTGIVILLPRGGSASGWLEVYPDAAVLGETYGHELRRWLLVAKHPPALRIQSPVTPVVTGDSGHARVIFGEQVSRVPWTGRRVCLIHPIGVPPEEVSELAKGSRVVLAGIDPTGGRYVWAEWARSRNVEVAVNEGLAADVRLRWPEVMREFGR